MIKENELKELQKEYREVREKEQELKCKMKWLKISGMKGNEKKLSIITKIILMLFGSIFMIAFVPLNIIDHLLDDLKDNILMLSRLAKAKTVGDFRCMCD